MSYSWEERWVDEVNEVKWWTIHGIVNSSLGVGGRNKLIYFCGRWDEGRHLVDSHFDSAPFVSIQMNYYFHFSPANCRKCHSLSHEFLSLAFPPVRLLPCKYTPPPRTLISFANCNDFFPSSFHFSFSVARNISSPSILIYQPAFANRLINSEPRIRRGKLHGIVLI